MYVIQRGFCLVKFPLPLPGGGPGWGFALIETKRDYTLPPPPIPLLGQEGDTLPVTISFFILFTYFLACYNTHYDERMDEQVS